MATDNRGLVGAIIGGTAAAFLSSLCCVGPLLYLVFGISAAGLSGLGALTWLQWPMIVLSLGLMAYGLWRLFLSSKPLCTGGLSLRSLKVLYLVLAPLALLLLFYPFILPIFLESA